MRTNKLYYLVFIIKLVMLAALMTSCATINVDNQIVRINYGTSFGMCAGYCKRDVTINPEQITYTCLGWNDSVQRVSRTLEINDSIWNSLKTDFRFDSFVTLPEVIGCPDCADGGAEWLEVELADGRKHKVTYEYRHEPVMLKSTALKLRDMLAKNGCNN